MASTGFLEPAEADTILERARELGAAVGAWGGFAGARRRVVTARPAHVPEATPALTALFWAGATDAEALRAVAIASGAEAAELGDVVRHPDGLSMVTAAPAPPPLLRELELEGARVVAREVPLAHLVAAEAKPRSAIVPSLRVDVLGARAFTVSRTYFASGVAAGRVRVNGRVAGKASVAELGDEVFADGLGRFRVTAVQGETRRGNLKVRLEVERSAG